MPDVVERLKDHLVKIIAETNGITLNDTLDLILKSGTEIGSLEVLKVDEFSRLLHAYHDKQVKIEVLLDHPVGKALFKYFHSFPLRFCEEHIHLTGSMTAGFIFSKLAPILASQNKKVYLEHIKRLFGSEVRVDGEESVHQLVTLGDKEEFDRYLKILELPGLILRDKKAHIDAAYHLAHALYHEQHVGRVRLKFTYSRMHKDPKVKVTPPSDVVLGLYEGFEKFKKEHPDFSYILSPCFRKEQDYFNAKKYKSKKEDFDAQVASLLKLMDQHPELSSVLTDVDTVGNERNLYRKGHFRDMQDGFRQLQARGFQIRSHHGEVWHTLRCGIQAVDNAMNIWHINNLEHGISLGINPNYYFHSLFQRVLEINREKKPLVEGSREYREVAQMQWKSHLDVRDQILRGDKLNKSGIKTFTKAKFRTAIEMEHYQHDVLNRMIQKRVSLVALPSSNKRLSGNFVDYKDHPFSWWEKKGLKLGVGTDNYVTLNTNMIREMLILLFSDSENLKITKLLMITTRETRRPFLSSLLWKQRQEVSF